MKGAPFVAFPKCCFWQYLFKQSPEIQSLRLCWRMRNDILAILANSYQKWTLYGFSLGKNEQTPWHNSCKVAKYYQRGKVFHIWQGGFSVNKASVRKTNGCVVFMGLHGFLCFLTLQRRKAVQTSFVLCYNYTWWSTFVPCRYFFSEVKWCQRCFIQKLKLQLHTRFPWSFVFFLVLQPCLGTFHSFEKLWWSNRNERSFTLCGWLLRVLGLHPKVVLQFLSGVRCCHLHWWMRFDDLIR